MRVDPLGDLLAQGARHDGGGQPALRAVDDLDFPAPADVAPELGLGYALPAGTGTRNELGRYLDLLWALRRGIRPWVPPDDRADFPVHCFQHLLPASCRTFKGKAVSADFPRVITAAAAGVACECLSERRAARAAPPFGGRPKSRPCTPRERVPRRRRRPDRRSRAGRPARFRKAVAPDESYIPPRRLRGGRGRPGALLHRDVPGRRARADAADQDVKRLAGQVRTLAEQLVHHAPEGWEPPKLARQATVQTHCHQHAIMKFDAGRELMRRAHLDAGVLDEGCCGLAGDFGFERGHYEVSMAVAEQGVLPAGREAAPNSPVLADGFSCRTRIEQGGTGRQALHLAEALALGLGGNLPSRQPERLAERPSQPSRAARWTVTVGAAALTTAAAAAAVRPALRHLRRP